MERRRAAALVGVALVAVLAACTPEAAPTPPTTPTPSQQTPTETQLQREERLAYEAAERAYREAVAEMDRLLSKGGASKASDYLRDRAAGPFLKDQVAILRSFRQAGDRIEGDLRMLGIQRAGYSPRELLLVSCEDGSGVRTIDSKGKVSTPGYLGTSTIRMKYIDNRWKVWSAKVEKQACTG
jgi:hypothetical protein